MIRLLTLGLVFASSSFVIAQDPAEKAAAPAEKPVPAEKPLATDKPAADDKAELDLSTTQLKASYAIGSSIGKSLKADGLDVDLASLTEGLRASLAGENLKLTVPEIRTAITTFQKEMEAKLVERRKAQGEKNRVEGKAFLAKNAQRKGVVTLESGLQYEVLKKGDGQTPMTKDRVKTHYHGTLLDGTVFDSSVERDEPISFGVTGVIAGWTEALQLMKEGDKWRLFVPSELAYKERGAGDDIGPHATLVFEVELLEIE